MPKGEKYSLPDQTLAERERGHNLGILWWGPHKSGKTVAAHSWPRTRTLDFDDGMESVLWAIETGIIDKDPSDIIYRTIIPETGERELAKKPSVLDRATDTLDDWKEDYSSWDTLIVDSLTALNDAAIARSMWYTGETPGLNYESPGRTKKLGFRVMGRADWGPAMSQLQGFIDQCREVLGYGKNLIVIAHEYTEETSSGIVTARLPYVIGKTMRQNLPRQFDEVWYQHINDDDERGIQTVETRLVQCGSRLGHLPEFLPNPTYDRVMQYVRGEALDS